MKTNFACSGVVEYNQTGKNLPETLILPNNQAYSFLYEATPGDSTKTTARVKRVTLPTGGNFEYEYPAPNNGINCSDGTVKNLTRRVNDGTNTHTWTFTRTQVGSDWKTVIRAPKLSYDSTGNERVFTFSGVKETSQKVYQGYEIGGTLKRTINTTWAGNGTPASQTTILDGSAPQSKVETVYDSYGNLKEIKEYDYGQSTLTRKTIIAYKHESDSAYTNRNIVDRVASIRVEDSSATKYSEILVEYDLGSIMQTSGAPQHDYTNFPYTFTIRGNPTKIRRWKAGTSYADTVVTYDDLGNVRTVQDPDAHTTTIAYTDSWANAACSLSNTLAYPTQITNALSQNTQFIYYPCTGALRERKDPNDIGAGRPGTRFTYEAMGRVAQTDFADGGQTTISYDDANRVVTATLKRTASNSLTITDTLNQLGLLTQRQLPGSRKVVITYDELQRQWKVSNPHVSTGDITYGVVETQFDTLGRVKLVKNQDGNSTVIDYSENATRVTDESSKKRITVADALGRVTKVCEVTAGNTRSPNADCGISAFSATNGYYTTFQYNVRDNLTQSQQGPSGQQQTRSFGYDNLSRLTSARILEVSTSTDVTCAYDDDGLQTNVTDPRGALNFEYDALHRPKKKKHGTTVVAEYIYDGTAAINAIGRLITEWDGPSGSADKTDYTYDPLGRMKTANRSVSGTTYNMSYTYDLLGNLDILDYPSSSGIRRKVQNAYNSNGELDKVTDITGTAYDYVTGATYSNLGPLAQLNLADAVNPTRTALEWNKRGQVSSMLTQKLGGSTHLDLDYTFHANGQIFEIINNLTNLKSEKFTYDDTLRLATAQRGPDSNIQRKYSYDYDRFGNRWVQTLDQGSGYGGTNSFDYGSNRVTSSGFSYDGSGNVTANGPGTSYTYNQENLMTAAGSSTTYAYDAQGRRVRKTVSGTVTDYFYSGAEVIAEKTGSNWTDYIFFGGQRIGKQTGGSLSTTTFLDTDHLGSVRVATNSSGSSVGTCDFEPFGEVQPGTTCTVPVDYRFAGMAWDSNAGPSGLYYTWFRRYDINQGRWMSVDPLAGSVDAPQSFDRFAYVLNDPAGLVDPLGLFPCPLAADNGDPIQIRGCDPFGNFTQSNPFARACFVENDKGCPNFHERQHAQNVLINWLFNQIDPGWSLEEVNAFLGLHGMELKEQSKGSFAGFTGVVSEIGPRTSRGIRADSFYSDASVRVSSQNSPFPRRSAVHAGSILAGGISVRLWSRRFPPAVSFFASNEICVIFKFNP